MEIGGKCVEGDVQEWGGWEMGNLGNWEWIGSKYIAYIYEVI